MTKHRALHVLPLPDPGVMPLDAQRAGYLKRNPAFLRKKNRVHSE